MASGDLTNLAAVKGWLSISSTSEDGLLARLITAASQFIQTWLNRDIAVAPYTETRDGNGRSWMVLSNFPVLSVSSVSINGQAIPASSGFDSPGYYITPTALYLRGYLFDKGQANVALTYSAGYVQIPPEIEQACIELVGLRYKERDRIGHASKAIQGETVSFTIVDMPPQVRTILNNYKKVVSL